MNASKLLCSIAALALASPAFSQSPEVSKEVKVDVKKVSVETQFTPDFTVNYTNPKRWKSKQWLELDVAFEVKKAPKPGDTSPLVGSLEFKYYVLFNKRDKDGKLTMLTANITYMNALERETMHAMAFVSPSALAGILEKTTFGNADVAGVGVEVLYGGQLAGGHSSGGGSFWQKSENFTTISGVLVPKARTPFHPLWGDYDLETSDK
jgi:hypothetical protein